MKITFLKAFNGDSIHISFTDENSVKRNILIDGGTPWTYSRKDKKGKMEFGDLHETIKSIREKDEFLDLLILTHTDEDHIGGLLSWFGNDLQAHELVKEVWFNSGSIIADALKLNPNKDLYHFIQISKDTNTSLPQGDEFSEYLKAKKIPLKGLIIQGQTINYHGLKFHILSPTKEKIEQLLKKWKKINPDLDTAPKLHDYAPSIQEHLAKDTFVEDDALPNGSSIAFVLNFEGNNFLFLGDSHPSVIVEGLAMFNFTLPIAAKLAKISHHGSKGNTNAALLTLFNAEAYVISTNGRVDQHPHKQLLSRIISTKKGCNIYFNYVDRMNEIFSEEDKLDFEFNLYEITKPFDYSAK